MPGKGREGCPNWASEEGQAIRTRQAERLLARQVAPPCICRGDGWVDAGCRACRPVGSWGSAGIWGKEG